VVNVDESATCLGNPAVGIEGDVAGRADHDGGLSSPGCQFVSG
jgi:hypothetical protein